MAASYTVLAALALSVPRMTTGAGIPAAAPAVRCGGGAVCAAPPPEHAAASTSRPAAITARAALDGMGTRRGRRVVVLLGAAAHTDRPDDRTVAVLQRDTAREGDQPAVGHLDVVQRAAGLGELADLAGAHVEHPRCPRLLDRDVDAAEPGPVHPGEGLEVAARVDYRDVHERAALHRLLQRGVEDELSLLECDVCHV